MRLGDKEVTSSSVVTIEGHNGPFSGKVGWSNKPVGNVVISERRC